MVERKSIGGWVWRSMCLFESAHLFAWMDLGEVCLEGQLCLRQLRTSRRPFAKTIEAGSYFCTT